MKIKVNFILIPQPLNYTTEMTTSTQPQLQYNNTVNEKGESSDDDEKSPGDVPQRYLNVRTKLLYTNLQ